MPINLTHTAKELRLQSTGAPLPGPLPQRGEGANLSR
jgi:hypothetical protein